MMKNQAGRKKPNPIKDIFKNRKIERLLLKKICILIFIGFFILSLVRHAQGMTFSRNAFFLVSAYIISAVLLHILLVILKCRGDLLLLPATIFLLGIGILAQLRMQIFSMENMLGERSIIYIVSFLCMLFVFILFRGHRFQRLSKFSWISAILSVLILGFVVGMGVTYRGARFGPGLTTPTEALKVLLVIFLAGYLSRYAADFSRSFLGIPLPRPGRVLQFLLIWSVPQFLILFQRDIGMIAIFTAVLIILFYTATGKFGYVVLGAFGTYGIGRFVYYFFSHGRLRIEVWKDPFSDPTGAGWQSIQSLSALFSGGILGRGFGMGNPEKIPVVSTDFIYAAIGEELGYLGCLAVIAVYLMFCIRCFKIASDARVQFTRLTIIGLTSILIVQVFINIGGVIKLLPVTGVTLPFISRGGSSLITNFVILGLLMAASESPSLKK